MYQETEEEKKQIEQAWAELAQAANEIHRCDARLLNAIKKVKGEKFHKDLVDLMEYCECGGGMFPDPLIICRDKKGSLVKEDFDSIQNYWVDQYENGGITGDSYAGYIYVEIKNGRYLKAHYSM